MSGPTDPRRVSIDRLLDELRQRRDHLNNTSLSGMLAGYSLETSELIDIVCVDLIERRRAGLFARVEDYAKEFPQLHGDEAMLDLIDAEICVSRELGHPIDLADYARRFPGLAGAIGELARLEIHPATDAPVHADKSDGNEFSTRGLEALETGSVDGDRRFGGCGEHRIQNDQSAQSSTDFSVDASAIAEPSEIAPLPVVAGHPLCPPRWFSPETYFANGPGRWLIRGRDSHRGNVMAMKIVELIPDLPSSQSPAILDACEAASKVRHPIWVAPSVAAIQQGHLAVIRPWVFGVAWLPVAGKRDVSSQLRDLASLAFCVEASHRAGAAHGGIHPKNVLINHDGKLRLVDAAASHDGLHHWLSGKEAIESSSGILPLTERQRIDIEQLLRLILQLSRGWQGTWCGRWINELQQIVSQHDASSTRTGIAEVVGEKLMQAADSQPTLGAKKPTRWSGLFKR